MKRSDSPGWWERYADKVGILGAIFAALCCLGLPALLTILSTIGLGFLVTDVVLIPLLVVFLVLTLVGLYLGTRHHDQPWAFWLGVVSSLWLIISVVFAPNKLLAGVSIIGLILASLFNGPILISGVDIQPKGQFLFQPFVFGEIGHQRFDNRLTTDRTDSPFHLRAVAPTGIFAYGITDHAEINVALSGIYWESSTPSSSGGRATDSESGVGDTTIYLKYRPVVQDPDSWRPSVTVYNQVALPSSQWFGTRGIPGGFSPLGRLPATRFGALSFTEGLLFRKNLNPFRISGGVFYTYTNPGSTAGMNTYPGDIVNTRLIIEHILNDEHGFGYNLEFVTLHGLPHRLDGQSANVNPTSFSLFGVQPTIQYKFFHDADGALVGAAGVLFTVAGQNNIDAIYPNISLYYYWGRGKVLMR